MRDNLHGRYAPDALQLMVPSNSDKPYQVSGSLVTSKTGRFIDSCKMVMVILNQACPWAVEGMRQMIAEPLLGEWVENAPLPNTIYAVRNGLVNKVRTHVNRLHALTDAKVGTWANPNIPAQLHVFPQDLQSIFGREAEIQLVFGQAHPNWSLRRYIHMLMLFAQEDIAAYTTLALFAAIGKDTWYREDIKVQTPSEKV